ncbi:hypothetical protein Tco_1150266, partial [Tanacetum coccineum]
DGIRGDGGRVDWVSGMVVMGGDDVGCTSWIGGGEDVLVLAEMELEQHLVELDLHQWLA